MSSTGEQERNFFLSEIKRVAHDLVRAPGIEAFVKTAGIPKHRFVGVYWAKWSDALVEAGFEANEKTAKFDSEDLLVRAAFAATSLGHVPTKPEMQLLRRNGSDLPHPDIFARHFGNFAGFRTALRTYCLENEKFAHVAAWISAESPNGDLRSSKHGHVYVLKSGTAYKIGRTDTLERRIKEVSIALPEALTLEHTISTDDPPGIEAYWHRRFADKRLKGEWFKLSREDVAAFRRRKFQ